MAFCRTVWNSLSITPRGDFRLCSLSNDPAQNESVGFDANGQVMNILTHTVEQGINSDKHRAVRLSDVRDEEWHSLCSCCENRELATDGNPTHPNLSRRIYVNGIISGNDTVSPINFYNKVDQQGQVSWAPSSIDIHFGNVCNFKCVQCGPQYSNQWYSEWAAVTGLGPNLHLNGFGPNKVLLTKDQHGKWYDANEIKWWESEIWWDKFKAMLPNLEHVYLTGGEPMLLRQHDRLLDEIIAAGRADKVRLEYDTNLSVINPRILDRWTKFKNIDLRISIDAIKDKYELIRYGGKWNTLVDNIKLVKSYAEQYPSIKIFRLTSCFQITTSHSMIETERWCLENNLPLSIRFVDTPKWHSVISLPSHMKQQLIEFYSRQSEYMVSDLIVRFLQANMNIHEPDEVKRFFKFMNYLDYTRKTDWAKTLPETAAMLKS
jgi:organic radical activating enzyme